MTDTFTASNGAQIVLTNSGQTGYVLTENEERVSSAYLGFEEMVAWREFEQHRRDGELGRWRWPENPDYVVYPLGLDHDGRRFASALHEPSAITGKWQEGQYRVDPPTESNDLGILAVQAYFEAHPERKPWHSAKPGEIWVLTIDDSEQVVSAVQQYEKDFNPISHPIYATFANGSERITDARKIWPEDAS